MIVKTKDILDVTNNGNFSVKQRSLVRTIGCGTPWELVNMFVPNRFWKDFKNSADKPKKRKKRKRTKAKGCKTDGFFKNNCFYKKFHSDKKIVEGDFYSSPEWRSLRAQVLEQYSCECMMCGRTPASHGIVIHVDHIKPISKYPKLKLDKSNLQLLCEDCNLGKSNKYETDWRPNDKTESN